MSSPLLVLPRQKHSKSINIDSSNPKSKTNYEIPFYPSLNYQRIHYHGLGGSTYGVKKSNSEKAKTRKNTNHHHHMEIKQQRQLSRFLGFWYLESSIRYILRKVNALFYNELCSDAYEEHGKTHMCVDPYFSIPVVFPWSLALPNVYKLCSSGWLSYIWHEYCTLALMWVIRLFFVWCGQMMMIMEI